MIKNAPLAHFLDQLASSAATPGGGGAAAVMGAMGAALVSMVCNLTIGKKNYAEVEADMQDLRVHAERLRARVADMIEEDARVFDGLMAAYGLPKDDEAQKSARLDAIQAALKQATDVPLNCARNCADIIALSRIAGEKGNRNVVSDAGVAALAAQAGLRSAALNVYINVPSIKDAAFATAARTEIDALQQRWIAEADAVFDLVKARL